MPKSLLLFIGLSKVLLSKTTNSYEEKILISIPSYGNDPSEVAILWKLISEEDMEVVLLHLMVKKGEVKNMMLSGRTLGLSKPL